MVSPIVIDVTRLVARQLKELIPSGVDQVSLEYIAYFREKGYALIRLGSLWVFLNKNNSCQLFDILLNQKKNKNYVKFLIIKSLILNIFGFNKTKDCWLLNTGHSGLHLKSYREKVKKYLFKPIYFIHDLIPITHPEYCRQGEKEKHVLRILAALQNHELIIVNSYDTQKILENFAIKYNLSNNKILVNFLGTKNLKIRDDLFENHFFNKKYFVILGTIEARKNHNLLLHIWRSLVEQNYPDIPYLIIIGRRGWECETTIDLLERCEKIRPFIKELNNCSDAELVNWLGSARALLFPSFIEGFGMPLAEAYAVGVPVIASDLAVYREFAQDIPDYIDPLDAIKWRHYILDYSHENSTLRKNQLTRMQNFVFPTWETHFSILEDYLKSYYVQ